MHIEPTIITHTKGASTFSTLALTPTGIGSFQGQHTLVIHIMQDDQERTGNMTSKRHTDFCPGTTTYIVAMSRDVSMIYLQMLDVQ